MRSLNTPLNLKRAAHGSATALMALALTFGGQALASADYGYERDAIYIHTAGYDLADKRDIRKLHRRISSNARILCSSYLHQVAAKLIAYNNCVDDTIREAVADSGIPALMAYEERRD